LNRFIASCYSRLDIIRQGVRDACTMWKCLCAHACNTQESFTKSQSTLSLCLRLSSVMCLSGSLCFSDSTGIIHYFQLQVDDSFVSQQPAHAIVHAGYLVHSSRRHNIRAEAEGDVRWTTKRYSTGRATGSWGQRGEIPAGGPCQPALDGCCWFVGSAC
jgi:hypothetical protein